MKITSLNFPSELKKLELGYKFNFNLYEYQTDSKYIKQIITDKNDNIKHFNINLEYNEFEQYLVIIIINNKFGFIDLNGDLKIPAIFSTVYHLNQLNNIQNHLKNIED
jgi:hypothetical protein